jgi:hypothetical protein
MWRGTRAVQWRGLQNLRSRVRIPPVPQHMTLKNQESPQTHPLSEPSMSRNSDIGIRRESVERRSKNPLSETEEDLNETEILHLIADHQPVSLIKEELNRTKLTISELELIRQRLSKAVIELDKKHITENPNSDRTHPLAIEYIDLSIWIKKELLEK